jgi:predicted DNA-binding protein (MmcQ/YjbR family)
MQTEGAAMELTEIVREVREDLSARPGVTLEQPFGDGVDVWKVSGKMYALMPARDPTSVSLKADPHLSEILREQYAGIKGGYHLNKRHWNTVALDADVPLEEVLRLTAHAYDQVVAGLPKKTRAALGK